ncbi:MAG: hypothetical protein KAQ87_03360 [Candidatus Pacebacteria bacterium]|nr:hypothetical protein [Candidatus Paceibacterota bacterium]
MNEIIYNLFFVGCYFILIGVLLIIFNRFIGINFCKMGKSIFSLKYNNKKINFLETKTIEYIYDEKKAPRIMKFIGVVSLIQGFIFVLIFLIANSATI